MHLSKIINLLTIRYIIVLVDLKFRKTSASYVADVLRLSTLCFSFYLFPQTCK